MAFTFARIGAVLGMKVEDYYANGKRWWVRLHEKGGKFHEVPAHHTLDEYLDAYIQAAGIAGDPKTPLFRSANRRSGRLTARALRRNNALDMVKRRAIAADFPSRICCHTFRATGITAYLEEGGTIEKAQAIAFHESPKTTKLYDRTSDADRPRRDRADQDLKEPPVTRFARRFRRWPRFQPSSRLRGLGGRRAMNPRRGSCRWGSGPRPQLPWRDS